MPFYSTDATTMCHIRMQSGNNQIENTHAFHWSGTIPSVTDLLSLATQLGTGNFTAALRNAISNGTTFREIYCRNIHTEAGAEATYIFPNGFTGQRAGNQVAANEACGIVKRLGHAGRNAHGRMSISTFAEGDVDGNTIGTTLMGLLGNLAVQLLVDFISGSVTFQSAVAHIPRIIGPTGTSEVITETVIPDNNVDSQKTRLNSHGR
jgi:hypothetical protein